MTWTVTIREVAEPDIRSALAWYESEAPQQAERFQVWYLTDPELRLATVIAVDHDRQDRERFVERR